jgi:hypothetical protein
MSLTKKGKTSLNVLIKEYGKTKGRRLFYSMEKQKPQLKRIWRKE